MPTAKEIYNTLQKNKDKNFVQRLLKPEGQQSIKNKDGSVSSHSMASGDGKVYPTVIKDKRFNRLYRLSGKAAAKYAASTGEYIKFDTDEKATEFGKEYKKIFTKEGKLPATDSEIDEVFGVGAATEALDKVHKTKKK